MMPDSLESYLRSIKRQLRLRGLADPATLAEIESHLLDAVEAGQREGLSLAEAQRRALERFGPARQLARQYAVESARERKMIMQKLLLGLAVAAGLFAAYVDALPKFDDTGILAFGILLAAGLLGLLGFRRPWLLALAVGAWIPLHDVLFLRSYGSLLALIFAFAGAYAGWGAHRLVKKSLNPA